MEYLIPILVASIVYIYNYRKLLDIKVKKDAIQLFMEENDKWIVTKFDSISDQIHKIDVRLGKLESSLKVYVGLAVFLSSIAVKFIDKLF